MFYLERISTGDNKLALFYERSLANPSNYIYNTIQDGISRLKGSRNVIRIDEAGLKGFLRANPFSSQELVVFGDERPTFPGFILSKNNPFTSVFRKHIDRMKESGTLQQLTIKWEGELKKKSSISETVVLGAGQVGKII